MNNLPSLVLNEIFSNFNLREKIKLKSVCKRWKMEIDNYKPTTLMIHLRPFRPNIHWSITNDSNNYEQTFCIHKIEEFNFIYLKLKNLKRLYIFQIVALDGFELLINKLDDFRFLEQLELRDLKFKNFQLNLLNLKILAMGYTNFDSLELNTPNLNTLVCFEDLNKIKLINPNSLITLFIYKYNQCVNQFNNLEFFNKLYKLKTLEFFSFSETVWQLNDYEFLNNSKLLNKFEIYRPSLPMQFVRNALTKIEDLKFIGFEDSKFNSTTRKITFAIYREENDKFQIFVQNRELHLFENVYEVIEFLKTDKLIKEFF